MALLKITALMLLLSVLSSYSQTEDITIVLPGAEQASTSSEDSTTIPLELNRNLDEKKSVWGASLLNLAIPGTGHLYLKDKRKAAIYIAADATLWLSFIFTHTSSKRRYDDAMIYARRYAHTETTRDGSDKTYWKDIGNFSSNDAFNDSLAFFRTFSDQYLGDDSWAWDDEDKREDYKEIRSDAGGWETASSILIGALILNRVVSFIDGRIAAQKYNNAQMKLVPTISLETKEVGAALLVSF